MLRTLIGIGAGWFIYTETGRKTFVNMCKNSVPLLEKELGINITKPFHELTKEPHQIQSTETEE